VLVFVKERLVILAVPKTGTTALETALGPRADIVVRDPPDLKHAPLYRYDRFFRPIFEKVCDARMETLAVVREPIDWLGSWYRYRRRPFMLDKPNSTHGIGFDDFVAAYCKGDRPGFADVGSQARFLWPRPGGAPLTHLFRYDDQPRLLAFLETRLGPVPDLGRENVSPAMDLSLSPKMAARLRRKCPEDFALYDSIAACGGAGLS
jgi:hypothetical protein